MSTTNKVIINDIDGEAVHTVDVGLPAEVAAKYPDGHPVKDAILAGKDTQITYSIGADAFTTSIVFLDN